MTMSVNSDHGTNVWSENDVKKYLRDAGMYFGFSQMEEGWRKSFLDFCAGKATLPLIYDTTVNYPLSKANGLPASSTS